MSKELENNKEVNVHQSLKDSLNEKTPIEIRKTLEELKNFNSPF